MTANEILADIENYEKFDPVKGTVEGKTYVVVPTTTKTDKDSDVVINRHITLAHNTTLIFAGGKISGTGTLTGDNTRLIAPITQIFGEDITVDGIWVMDRAYPQWFGARNDISNNEFWHLRVACEAAKSTEENPLAPEAEKDKIEKARDTALKNLKAWKVDSSDAINKAMKLKHAGEVFLPKGEYAICKTLKVPYGIVLRGELADYRFNISDGQLPAGDYPLGGDTTPDRSQSIVTGRLSLRSTTILRLSSTPTFTRTRIIIRHGNRNFLLLSLRYEISSLTIFGQRLPACGESMR